MGAIMLVDSFMSSSFPKFFLSLSEIALYQSAKLTLRVGQLCKITRIEFIAFLSANLARWPLVPQSVMIPLTPLEFARHALGHRG